MFEEIIILVLKKLKGKKAYNTTVSGGIVGFKYSEKQGNKYRLTFPYSGFHI